MSAAYVRDHYGVDYKRGDRVTIDGKPGTVVSFPGQYLGVRLDGQKHTSRAHPTWRVERIYPRTRLADLADLLQRRPELAEVRISGLLVERVRANV